MKNLFLALAAAAFFFAFPAQNLMQEKGLSTGAYKTVHEIAGPAIDLSDVQPVDAGGNVIYLTCTPKSSSEKKTGLLSVFFQIKNKEGKNLKIEKITYTAGSVSSTFTGKKITENISGADDNTTNVIENNASLK